MKRKWIFAIAPFVLALFVFIGGEVVMHLWNWLAPMLLGLRTVTFWQAVGLLLLCRILFGGGIHGGSGHAKSRARRRMEERWEKMSPEEREKFQQWCQTRWGGTPGPNQPA